MNRKHVPYGGQTTFRESLRKFFRSKRLQLLAAAREADTPHAGLLGGHRERLIEGFWSPLLPRRFSTGRGIVYGMAHQSRECDIVVWDSENYFCLPFTSHGHYFAESVRLVLESKSNYSSNEWGDVLQKSRAVRDIVPNVGMNLADEIAMLQLEVQSLRAGVPHDGMLHTTAHIATAAFFFFGGQSVALPALVESCDAEIDDAWPDIVVFLESGKLILKQYSDENGKGCLEFYDLGEDALLVFAASAFEFISERSVQVENPAFLAVHVDIEHFAAPLEVHSFRLTRFPASRQPLWRK